MEVKVGGFLHTFFLVRIVLWTALILCFTCDAAYFADEELPQSSCLTMHECSYFVELLHTAPAPPERRPRAHTYAADFVLLFEDRRLCRQ